MAERVSANLVLLASAGDRTATEAIRAAYEDRLRAFFWTHGVAPDDAADLVQETFTALFEALRDGRVSPDRAEGWIFRTARNIRVDMIRRRVRERGEAVERSTADDAAPWSDAEREECRQALRNAIDRLPDRYRVPLLLRVREGLSYREIATRLGTNPSTVGVWLHRARRLLRDDLDAV